jgi:hypothetical protein
MAARWAWTLLWEREKPEVRKILKNDDDYYQPRAH